MFSDPDSLFSPSQGLTNEETLRQLCEEGVALRYGNQRAAADARERLDCELDHIRRTRFTKHFLLMHDVVDFAKRRGIPVGLGRDWQPSSLVAYVLGITDIDPIRYGLIFEMWFNPERIASPCLEVDIAHNGCNEMIEYVLGKHGECILPVIVDADGRSITLEGDLISSEARFFLMRRGFFVFDLHPQKSPAVIQAVLKSIREAKSMDISLNDVPLDDPATYKILTRGDILGVFEIGSPQLADRCIRIRPSELADIAALVGLDFAESDERVALYAHRKDGESPVFYEHALLEPILRETYGMILYREQYVQAVECLAGYTRGRADLLRRVNLRDDPALMAKHLPAFVENCAKRNNIPEHAANQLFDGLNKTAKTLFPKSHAISRALLAYRAAYLKAHYSPEFYSALIEHHHEDPGYVAKIRNEVSFTEPLETH